MSRRTTSKQSASVRPSKTDRRHLSVERLERRELFAALPTAFMYGGNLYIDGTHGNDHIQVRFAEGKIEVPGVAIKRENGQLVNRIDRSEVPNYVVAVGQAGNDRIEAVEVGADKALPMVIYGSQGDDVLIGGSANDAIFGMEGVDTIEGRGGDDRLYAALFGSAQDLEQSNITLERVWGGEGNDQIYGSRGSDFLDGGAGDDVLTGLDGNDHLVGGTGADKLYGGTGADVLDGGDQVDVLDGGEGWDRLTSANVGSLAYLSNQHFYNGSTSLPANLVPQADLLSGIEEVTLTTSFGRATVNTLGFGGKVMLRGPHGTAMEFDISRSWRARNFVNVGPQIWAKYGETATMTAANGASVQSVLGAPVANEEAALNGGRQLRYQGGTIYYSAVTGARVVYGAIMGKYAATAHQTTAAGSSVQRTLGLPVTDEMSSVNGGRITRFQGGAIFWTPAAGAYVVYGPIGDKYASLSAERGGLGYPISDVLPGANGGRFSRFQNGTIYWSSATGAHVVHGDIGARYASLGAERSDLGYPTSDELPVEGGGRVSEFANGTIYWTSDRVTRVSLVKARYFNGKLVVTGSSQGDTINVYNIVDNISVADTPIRRPIFGGFIYSTKLPSGWVQGVEVHAGAGNDTVRMHDKVWGIPSNRIVPVTIYGGAGNDVLIGGRGNDGLFGGDGYDRLIGGAGADRFLIGPELYTPDVTDRTAEDALITFLNSTEEVRLANSADPARPGRYAARSWTDAEIEAADQVFAWLHQLTGNVKLLKTAYEGAYRGDMSFTRAGAYIPYNATDGIGDVADQQANARFQGYAGWNNSLGRIVITDLGAPLSADGMDTIVHEVMHNWDAESSIFGEWMAVSDWHRLGQEPDGTYTISGDGAWVTSGSMDHFFRDYGRTNPREDWCTAWEAYYGASIGTLDAATALRVQTPGDVFHTKFNVIEKFVRLMR